VFKLQAIRKYVPWIGASFLLPLAVFIFVSQSSTVVEEKLPKNLPPRLSGLQAFPGFELPPLKCIQDYRWPHQIEFCEYKISSGQEADMVKFYEKHMGYLGWTMRAAKQEGWKSPMANSEVLVFFSREDIHFFIEKKIEKGDLKNETYRVLFTSILNTQQPKE
jgi:hypothetical protein